MNFKPFYTLNTTQKPTHKEQLVKAFMELNANGLDQLLEPGKWIQDVSKELFVAKAASLFKHLRALGDTELIKTKGRCRLNGCSEEDCLGFHFQGNYSEKHISFIFLEKDGLVDDIFVCNDFFSTGSNNRFLSLPFQFEEDEKFDFKPNTEYLLIKKAIDDALSELKPDTMLPIETIELWYNKHCDTRNRIISDHLVYKVCSDFLELFDKVENLVFGWENRMLFERMHEVRQALHNHTERQILMYLANYEMEVAMYPPYVSAELEYDDIGNPFYLLSETYNLRADGMAFLPLLQVKKAFDHLYQKKYRFYAELNEKMPLDIYEISVQKRLNDVLMDKGIFLKEIKLTQLNLKGISTSEDLIEKQEATDKLIDVLAMAFKPEFLTDSKHWHWHSFSENIITLKSTLELRTEFIEIDLSNAPLNIENEDGTTTITLFDRPDNRNKISAKTYQLPLIRQVDWMYSNLPKILNNEWKLRIPKSKKHTTSIELK